MKENLLFISATAPQQRHSLLRLLAICCMFFTLVTHCNWAWGQTAVPTFNRPECYTQSGVQQPQTVLSGQPPVSWNCLNYVKVHITFVGGSNYTAIGNAYNSVLGVNYTGIDYANDIIRRMNELLAHNMLPNICNGWLYYSPEANVLYGTPHRDAPADWTMPISTSGPEPGFRFVLASSPRFTPNTLTPTAVADGLNLYIRPGTGGSTGAFTGNYSELNDQANIAGCSLQAAGVGLHELLHNMSLDHNFNRPYPRINEAAWDISFDDCPFFTDNYDKCTVSFDWANINATGHAINNTMSGGCTSSYYLCNNEGTALNADPDGLGDTPFCWDCNELWTSQGSQPLNSYLGCNDPKEIDNNLMNYVFGRPYGHSLTQEQINKARQYLNSHSNLIDNSLSGTEQKIDVYINSGGTIYGIEPFKTWDCANDIDFLCITQGDSHTLTAASTTTLTPLSYLWSTGAMSQTITVAPTTTTTYTVTITNSEGCTGTDQILVKSPPAHVEFDPSYLEFCIEEWNAGAYTNPNAHYHLVPSNVSSNVATYTWLLNGSLAGQGTVDCPTCFDNGTDPDPTNFNYWTSSFIDIAGANSGIYTLIVTADNSCTASASVSVDVHINPVPEIMTETLNTGLQACTYQTIPITAHLSNNDAAPYIFTWSTGQTGQSIILSNPNGSNMYPAGNTYVTVTDVNGCTAIDGAGTWFVPPPTVTIAGNTNLCGTGSTTLTAVGGETYQWSNGSTTANITITTPGIYTVTATQNYDSPGENGVPSTYNPSPPYPCSTVTSVNVTVTPPITPILQALPTPICPTDAPINLTQYVSNYANVMAGGSFTIIGTSTVPQSITQVTTTFNPALFTPGTYTIQYSYQPAGCDAAFSQIQTIVLQSCTPLDCIAQQTYLYFNATNQVVSASAPGALLNYTAPTDADNNFVTWTPASNPFGAGLGLATNPVKINGTITIPAGSEIRIDGMNFVFGPNGRIDIKRRGQLTLKRSTFEGDPTCNTMWQGFRVWGPGVSTAAPDNEGGEQQDAGGGIHTGMLLFDGDPDVTTNVVVRDALIGVATTRLDNYNLATVASSLASFNAGGIPYALNNSTVSVLPQIVGPGSTQAEGYGGGWLHIRKASGARFENCFYGTLYTQYQGISYINPAALAADGINGYKVDAATFTTNGNLRYPFVGKSTEVGVAGLKVTKTKLSIANSIFENLVYGIRANDLRLLNIRSFNQFNNCLRGISTQVSNLGATQFTRIEGNTFNSCTLSIQADALQTLITGNTIVGPVGTLDQSVGIFMRDSDYSIGGAYGAIANYAGNFISDVTIGIATIGGSEDPAMVISPEIKNNTISRTYVAIHAINDNDFLDIRCNYLDYTNRGINVRSWNGTQGNLKDQGDCFLNQPSFNSFLPLGGSAIDLFADASSLPFTYNDINALSLSTNNLPPPDPTLITTVGCFPITSPCNIYSPSPLGKLIDNSTDTKTKYAILSEWLRKYQADSNYVAAAALLEQNTALPIAAQKMIQQYYDTENYAAANNLLEGIDRTKLEAQQFYTLQKLLIALKQEGKSYAQINATQEATLLSIANSQTSVGYRAQAVLYQARGYEFPAIIPPINDTDVYGYTVFKTNMSQNNLSTLVTALQPNPTNNEAQLNYNLPDKQTATLLLYDLNGKLIHSTNFVGNGTYTLSTNNLANSIYFYTIVSNGEVLMRNKLVVIK